MTDSVTTASTIETSTMLHLRLDAELKGQLMRLAGAAKITDHVRDMLRTAAAAQIAAADKKAEKLRLAQEKTAQIEASQGERKEKSRAARAAREAKAAAAAGAAAAGTETGAATTKAAAAPKSSTRAAAPKKAPIATRRGKSNSRRPSMSA